MTDDMRNDDPRINRRGPIASTESRAVKWAWRIFYTLLIIGMIDIMIILTILMVTLAVDGVH